MSAQAAALAYELNMHLDDLLDDRDLGGEGFPLVSEDDDTEVGRAFDLAPGMNDCEFLVKTADGKVLRVSVEEIQ
jgi:hypothetical protein